MRDPLPVVVSDTPSEAGTAPDPPALDGSRTMKVHSALQTTHRSRQLSRVSSRAHCIADWMQTPSHRLLYAGRLLEPSSVSARTARYCIRCDYDASYEESRGNAIDGDGQLTIGVFCPAALHCKLLLRVLRRVTSLRNYKVHGEQILCLAS